MRQLFFLISCLYSIICYSQYGKTYEYTIKLQQVEVLDSAMFDAIIETMHSDSLQSWVNKYHYPNYDALIKNYKYTEVGFNRYEEKDTVYLQTSITYAKNLHAEYYTYYKKHCIYITNFPLNHIETLKYIRPIDKFRYLRIKTHTKNIGDFIILVFNFHEGRLHICTDDENWIRALE